MVLSVSHTLYMVDLYASLWYYWKIIEHLQCRAYWRYKVICGIPLKIILVPKSLSFSLLSIHFGISNGLLYDVKINRGKWSSVQTLSQKHVASTIKYLVFYNNNGHFFLTYVGYFFKQLWKYTHKHTHTK